MKKFNKALLVTALAGVMAPALGHAATITIPAPSGAVISDVAVFDWAPSSTIAVDGNKAFVDFVNSAGACSGTLCRSDVFGHGQLSSFNNNNNTPLSAPGLGSSYEITFELGFSEKVIAGISLPGVINTAVFGFGPSGKTTLGTITTADAVLMDGTTPNFFRMYVDTSPDANSLAGTGFGAGPGATLVLAGRILPHTDFNSNFTANLGTPLPIGGAGGITPNPQWFIGGNPVTTVTGSGATTTLDVLIAPVTVNQAFFGGIPDSFLLSSISQLLPFDTTNPSVMFPEGSVTDAVTAVAGNGLHINGGTTGGIGGAPLVATNRSVEFQNDSASPVHVPEPGTLALLGLGLAGIALRGRRRKQAV